MSKNQLLFSYGTLQNTQVQKKTFGRKLESFEDVLPGYKLEMVEINDCDVASLSGDRYHPIAILTANSQDEVKGKVFKLTDQELNQADTYEVDAYKRIKTPLKSGVLAWAYVSAQHNNDI